MAAASIWDRYPDLAPDELRALVTVTARTLADAQAEEAGRVSADVLQDSPRRLARELTPTLQTAEPELTSKQVQVVFEDEALAVQACMRILDEVRDQPELAQRVATAYDERLEKMTGVELVLLAGALVVLAIRIKRLRWGDKEVEFEPAGEAVATFVAGLAKAVGGV
jgi:hypothetical protein